MRRFLNCAAWLVVLALLNPVSARADTTVLGGLTSVDAVRPSFAFSFGHRPSAVGFEIEYLSTFPSGHSAGGAFASVIVVPPRNSKIELFVVGGVGVWAEGFPDGSGTGLRGAGNVGGGVLVPLAGPLMLRLDYRLFVLGGGEEVGYTAPSTRFPQRFAAGLHLKF